MANGYEINDMAKEESWRLFRIMGEMVEGFDGLSGVEPAVTIYGSARIKPNDELYTQTIEIAHRLGELGFSIITGGGPGIMEAANRGAAEAGAKSVGLNIELPVEQACNVYATKVITFKHFFVRKVMLVKYATAFIIMPGGLGFIDWLHTTVAPRNYIAIDDFNLLRVCDTPTSVVETVQQWYIKQEVAGQKALGHNNGAGL